MTHVSAGAPVRPDAHSITPVDLFDFLIRHPEDTYLVPVAGDSMDECGIADGDLLLVDRAIEPRDGDTVIVDLDGQLTVKRLSRAGAHLRLVPCNPRYRPYELGGEDVCTAWGVVIHIIKSRRRLF